MRPFCLSGIHCSGRGVSGRTVACYRRTSHNNPYLEYRAASCLRGTNIGVLWLSPGQVFPSVALRQMVSYSHPGEGISKVAMCIRLYSTDSVKISKQISILTRLLFDKLVYT